MKSTVLILLCAFCCFPLAGQVETELAPFDVLRIMGKFTVELIPAEQERITVKAYGIEADRIKITQQGRNLKVSTLRSLTKDDVDIRIKIYYRELTAIYASGGVEIESDDPLEGDELFIRAGSGSEVYLEVKANELEAQAAEGGHLTIKGEAVRLDGGANTGGIFDGHRLVSQNARLRAGTGGEVSARVEERLDARANTGGTIRYAGSPNQVDSKTALGGEIKALDGRSRRR